MPLLTYLSLSGIVSFYRCIQYLLQIQSFIYFNHKSSQTIQMNQEINKSKKLINNKKTELLDQFKQKQSKYRRQIEQLQQEANQTHTKIIKECEEFNTTAKKLKQKAEEFLKDCAKSLDVEFMGKEIINIKQLASYLKVQKQMLVKLSSKQKPNTNKNFDIHVLLSKSKFEQTLRKMKKIQLQQEIKYLQTNVLVKNNIVYNAATSTLISASEQKQINSRLETQINELERVIGLSISCTSHQDSSDKLIQLQKQTNRLKQCQSLLLTEYEKLNKLIKYFQSQCLNIPTKSFSLQKKSFLSIQTQQKPSWEHKRIFESQLDQINSSQLPQSMLVGKYQHSFDACEQKIDVIRKKFRQFENLTK